MNFWDRVGLELEFNFIGFLSSIAEQEFRKL